MTYYTVRHRKSRIMRIAASIAFMALLSLPSCRDSESEANNAKIDDHSMVYASGEFANGKYEHRQIGFSIESPKNWTRWTRDQMRTKIYQAALAETGDKSRAELEASDMPGSYQLLTLFKNPEEAPGRYNPSIVVDAKSAKILAENGIPDFDAWLSLKQNPEAPRTTGKQLEKITGVELECWQTRLVGNYPNGVKIYQDTYDYDLGDYWVAIIVSGSTEVDVEEMKQFALSLRRIE